MIQSTTIANNEPLSSIVQIQHNITASYQERGNHFAPCLRAARRGYQFSSSNRDNLRYVTQPQRLLARNSRLYGSRSRVVRGRSGRSSTLLRSKKAALLVMGRCILLYVSDGKTELSRTNIPVAVNQQKAEDWFGNNIENTVEHGFTIGVDDVAAFGKTPGDGVQEPNTNGEDTALVEGTGWVGTQSAGMATSNEDEGVNDIAERQHSKNPVAP